MHIVMVAGHACIRVQKMAIPLIERGHKVHLIASKIPNYWQMYSTFVLCEDVENYLEAVRLHDAKGADLFHCHNEPSWFTSVVKEVTDKPVIMDVHDSFLARSTKEEATQKLDEGKRHVRVVVEERTNFQLADGLVFPSETFQHVVSSEFGLEQPALVMPSYVPERFYRYNFAEWHGGLVYEGKVSTPDEQQGFEYCDYTDLADQCAEIGMDLHLYAGRNEKEFSDHYHKSFVHNALDYDQLLKAIARHDWGLVGNIHKHKEWSVAAPNKLFEYIASGVPVVAMNADWCGEFLEKTGFGIAVSSVAELAERWSEHRRCRANVMKRRKDWSMNAHINKLEGFYHALAA